MTATLTSPTEKLISHLLSKWPEHSSFIEKSFAQRNAAELAVSNRLSSFILALAADEPSGLDTLCDDYRFLCEDIVLPEEIHFRRNGCYRLSSFADANAECYANGAFMARYMNGLLLSDVLWANHASAFAHFVNAYLPQLGANCRHLEIGPGHGLFLHFAACHPGMKSVTGWDISPTSIAKTRHALKTLAAPLTPELLLNDMFDAASDSKGGFDSLVMSEILEHLEDPSGALTAVRDLLVPRGRLFVNVPANSPAPDHIFLFNSLDHACEIVRSCGYSVIDAAAYPMSGTTLERALRHKLAVSCVVIAERPDDYGKS